VYVIYFAIIDVAITQQIGHIQEKARTTETINGGVKYLFKKSSIRRKWKFSQQLDSLYIRGAPNFSLSTIRSANFRPAS